MIRRKYDRFFIQWHITHKCNLRCIHCYQDDYSVSATEEELFSTLEKLDSFFKYNDLKGQINLTGGEPLCHPAFFDLAESIVGRGIILGILTNGTLIDDSTAKRISELHPLFVQVSLDGTSSVHDAIRGEGNYAKAVSGIDNLKKYGVKVLVSFTAQKGNIKDYPALADECLKHCVDKLWWDRVVADSSDESKKLALSNEEFVYMLKQTGKLRVKYKKKGLNVDNKRALQFLYSHDKNGYVCGAGKNLAIILSDGSVMPCRRLPFIIGNIYKNSLADILNSSDLMHELASHAPPEECFKCKYLNICEGGAKCVTYAMTGKLYDRDVNCPVKLKRCIDRDGI